MADHNELRAFLEVMRRRRGVLLRSLVGVVGLAMIYLWFAPTKYDAQALILVDQAQKNLLESDPLRNAVPADNSHVESEVEILRSSAVALDVIEAADLENDPDYAWKPSVVDRLGSVLNLWGPQPETKQETTGRVLVEFQRNASINRRGLTYIISVSVSSSRPERAAELTNLLATAYFERQMRAKLEQSVVERDIVQSQIAVLEAEASAASTAQARDDANANLSVLTARLRDLETQAQLQVPDSRIVAQALPPIEPSAPRTLLILAAAIVGGGLLGFALVYVSEVKTNGVTSADRLSDLVDAPVATIVPYVPRRFGLKPPVTQQVIARPLSPFTDSVRRLKASLDQWFDVLPKTAENRGQVILATSSVPGEGKTTMALSLARIYAQSGKRTVLIDADFRKPQVHKLVGKRASNGLAEYLRDPKANELPIVQDGDTQLTLLLGANDAQQSTEDLLTSAMLAKVLASARQNFDIVVVDSAPMVPAADTRYLAREADAVVFTCKHASTDQAVVRSAAEALVDAMPVETSLFAVLNQYRALQKDYGYAVYHSGGQIAPVPGAQRLNSSKA